MQKKKIQQGKLLLDRLNPSRLRSPEVRIRRQNSVVHIIKQVMDMMSVCG